MMTRSQLIVLSSVIFLFCLLYFGMDTKSSNRSSIDRTRSLSAETTGINALLPEAKARLSADQLAIVNGLETMSRSEENDSTKISLTEKLSANWYDLGRPDIAGYYAEQIAAQVNTAEAWSIAGTTYAIGAQRLKEDKVRTYCSGRAVKAFESAISLDPADTNHQLNLAVCYADNPPTENPMKGILMLLDLNRANPDDVPVLNTLARFGIKTGQFAKAVQRLEKVLGLDPDNKNAICLLVKAYQGLGESAKAAAFSEKCQSVGS